MTPAASEAETLNERASAQIEARRFAEAIPDAERAAHLLPSWIAPWANLSVAYKHVRRWRDCLAAVERVIAEEAQVGDHWNAGIAATALGDWSRARRAWRAAGILVPDGDGPIEMQIGPGAVRLEPGRADEVVWCERVDPVRARIASVPLPSSGRRRGDLVLHDGEPRGKRRWEDRVITVFDELLLLQAAPTTTWELVVDAATPAAIDDLFATVPALAIEDWTGSIDVLCAACSLGAPHEHGHDHAPLDAWNPERRIGVDVPDDAALAPLRRGAGWLPGIRRARRVL